MRSEAEHLAIRVARCERMLIALMEEYNSTHMSRLYSSEDWNADEDLSLMKDDHQRWESTGQV
jgi:hypothetical protein